MCVAFAGLFGRSGDFSVCCWCTYLDILHFLTCFVVVQTAAEPDTTFLTLLRQQAEELRVAATAHMVRQQQQKQQEERQQAMQRRLGN